MIESLWRDFASDPAVTTAASEWIEEVGAWARAGEARGIILAGLLAVVADLCGWRSRASLARAREGARLRRREPAPR